MIRRYRLHVTVDIDSDDEPHMAVLEEHARQLADGLKESDAYPDLAASADVAHAVYFVDHGVEQVTDAAKLHVAVFPPNFGRPGWDQVHSVPYATKEEAIAHMTECTASWQPWSIGEVTIVHSYTAAEDEEEA